MRIYGLPQEKHPRAIELIKQGYAKAFEDDRSKLIPASLKPESLQSLKMIEEAAHGYFRSKFEKLGIPNSETAPFPPVYYAKKDKTITKKEKGEKREKAGYFDTMTGLCVVYANEKGEDVYDSYGIVAHELSHATVFGDARYNFPEDKSKGLQTVNARGVGLVGGDFKHLGKGMEEGLIYLDQVEFVNQHVSKMHPSEYTKRRNWAQENQRLLIRYISKIDQKIYGQLTPELIAPFIDTIGPGFTNKIRVPNLETEALKEFMFARKLCEVVGRRMPPPIENIKPDDAIKRGRDLLDKERYARTGEVHRTIVNILGGKNSKDLFALDAHADATAIDSVMSMLLTY